MTTFDLVMTIVSVAAKVKLKKWRTFSLYCNKDEEKEINRELDNITSIQANDKCAMAPDCNKASTKGR